MLWNLDVAWLMMAIAVVVVLSLFFGSALDWLRRGDNGFGSFGNGVILAASFFVAILVANYQGYNLRDLHLAVLVGLFGAFLILTC